ncbi:fungal-specific transcription factor domain-containing protein [Annulohypoxylon bovei var. microspora]|nr:fungal-specific transcription factor domain-containing protein [Annulohypoxylon bovei var. microspora]
MELPRKACDLCYRKKIKCDGQTPRCSPCMVYDSNCTFQAVSRKTPSRKQATIQRQLREDSLQSRVKTLEGQLSTVLEKVERLERLSGSEKDVPNSIPPFVSGEFVGLASQASNLPILELPSYQEVMPVVECYIATFNSVLPLFHPGTLLQTVKSWYQNPHSRDPVIWAMINVVLALACHTGRPGDLTPIGNTATYLNNAQSVLTEVIMRETALVNVQVLLGMVILFWTADDLRPALVLIATALRLAHRLGFHSRKSSEHLGPTAALQQTRVFWMAYILDRDISLYVRLAPVQLDSEIDLDLPPLESKDDLTGFIFASGGHAKVNFFRARIELARIQGKVYECIYSVSAQNSSSEERAQNVTRISTMLDEWNSQIPPDFHPSILVQTNRSVLSRYFCILYATHLSCRALISFGSAWDSFHYSKWLGHLQDYSEKIAAGQVALHAPMPQGWPILLEECRGYMRLFATIIPSDNFFIRMTLCGYNSSLISLTANNIFNPHCGTIRSDKELTRTGTLYLDEMVKQTGRIVLQNVRDSVIQLGSYADLISQNVHAQIWSSMSLQGGELQSNFLGLPECQHIGDEVSISPFESIWTVPEPSSL